MVQTMMLVFLAFQAVGTRVEVTPVEKVVMMLKNLQSQVSEEGQAEAATYDKYGCFCKSTTDEKSTAIKEGEASVATLSADMDTLQSRRTSLERMIDTCNANINLFNEELANATAMRRTERTAYEAAFADMDKACTAIRSAITTLKASKNPSDASFASVKAAVSKTLIMADAIGYDNEATSKAKVFLEQPVSDYDYHSDDIIKTLEGLLSTFVEKKTDLESEEVSTQAAFDSAAQAKKDQISTEQTTLELKQKELTQTTAELVETQQQLSEANAILNDDRVYLSDLTHQCEDKAKMWDQRQELRAGELSAITQALSVIEGAVTNKAVLSGQGARSEVITSALDTSDDSTEEFALEDIMKNEFAFVQVSEQKKKKKTDARVHKVMALLKTLGAKLNSKMLSTLASKVSEDPFAKVKTLIQELIERLMQEAGDEANQKGWCDTEISKAEKDRDYRVRDLDELESSLMAMYGRKVQLEGTVEKLTEAIGGLNADLLNATQTRQEEKAENAETVANAQDGEVAVQQAIDILSHFYGEAKQAVIAESKSNATDLGDSSALAGDIPDAGFDSAYTGSQSTSTGIIGMLEVIRGDFQRTARDTQMDESKAEQEFVEYERTTKMSIATKSEALANTRSELEDTNVKIDSSKSDYESKQALLDAAIQALEGLHPVCLTEGGSSYEDRSERRKAEIEALKEALCILDEGAGDYCGHSFLQTRGSRYA